MVRRIQLPPPWPINANPKQTAVNESQNSNQPRSRALSTLHPVRWGERCFRGKGERARDRGWIQLPNGRTLQATRGTKSWLLEISTKGICEWRKELRNELNCLPTEKSLLAPGLGLFSRKSVNVNPGLKVDRSILKFFFYKKSFALPTFLLVWDYSNSK